MSTTTLRKWSLCDNGLVLCPGFSLNVERVDVAESDTGVVKTAVTTVNPDFAFVVAGTSVGSRWGSLDN
jgi:hypothetical protein